MSGVFSINFWFQEEGGAGEAAGHAGGAAVCVFALRGGFYDPLANFTRGGLRPSEVCDAQWGGKRCRVKTGTKRFWVAKGF